MQWASLAGVLVTTASVIFGVLTYRRGAHEQRQAAAMGILQDYLKFSVDHPDLVSGDEHEPVDARYEWFMTHTLFTAETLWALVGDDQRWTKTLEVLVRPHRGYLHQGTLSCDAYTPGFVAYLKDRFPELKCAQQ